MPPRRLLAIWAHPDDEAFGPVGTMCLARDRGWQTALITATRGEAGRLGKEQLAPETTLGDLREAELRCASAVIGVTELHIWHHPDGQLKSVPPRQLTEDILAVMRDWRPQVVLTFGPDGITGHPDHLAVGAASERAFLQMQAEPGVEGPQRLYYVTIAPERKVERPMGEAPPPKPVTARLDVSAYREVKLRALACHASQCEGWEPLLGDEDWLTTDRFFRAYPPHADGEPLETTLFG